MGVREALAFTAAVRERPALAERVAALGPAATLDDVVAIAAEAGFAMTAEDLRSAHRHDWAMRTARYSVPPDEVRDA